MRTYVYGKPQDIRGAVRRLSRSGQDRDRSIDMHRGHLDPSPDCPCPRRVRATSSRRSTLFTISARELGVPIIHVRSVLRRGGEDDISRHQLSMAADVSALCRRNSQQRRPCHRRLAMDRIRHPRRSRTI